MDVMDASVRKGIGFQFADLNPVIDHHPETGGDENYEPLRASEQCIPDGKSLGGGGKSSLSCIS